MSEEHHSAMVVVILFVVALFAAASYYIMSTASGATIPTEAMKGGSAMRELTSISQATVNSDKSGSLVSIDTPTGVAGDQQKGLMDDVMFATKGDGTIRDVNVDGKPLDSALVKLAMFDNHDFMPRDEFPQQDKKARFESGTPAQRSHFGKMTYPLVWSGGALVTDQMVRSV